MIAPSNPELLNALSQQEQLIAQQNTQLVAFQQQLERIDTRFDDSDRSLENIGNEIRKLNKTEKLQKPAMPAPLTCPKPEKEYLTVENKHLLGRIEWLWLEPLTIPLKARIDTGAGTSSLSAINIVEVELDGKKYARFELEKDPEDEATAPITMTLPIVKYVKIRQSSTKKLDRRPVVMVSGRIGPIEQHIEFTLADRTHLNYPILLGREFLQDIAIVDVSKKFIYKKNDK